MSEADWKFMQERWGLKDCDRKQAAVMYGEVCRETDARVEELFGQCENLPDDESEIVFADLPHDEKLIQLQAVRSAKVEADRIHARALGVVLG